MKIYILLLANSGDCGWVTAANMSRRAMLNKPATYATVSARLLMFVVSVSCFISDY